MTAPTPREINERDHAVQDDADNVRPDYPAAVHTIVTAVRDLAATERERDALRAEVERIKGYAESGVAAEAKAVRQLESEVERVRKERDEYADRLSVLLCDLTNGRLSKPTYDVGTMVQEIVQVFSEELEADAEARVEKAEATVARVEALMDGADPAFGAVTLADLRAALKGGDDE